MGQVIFYLFFAIISQLITYKIVRRIDLKERKFLRKWELEYIKAYKDIWKKAYFEKLAEEKKIKEYEKEKSREKKERSEALKEVTIDDEFRQEYDQNLENAVKELEAKECA